MSGLGRPFDLLLTFKEAPDGVPHLYCQEDTQALGLRTQPSVGETGYSNPPKGEAGLQVLRASTTLWSASSSEGKPEPSSHSEEWRGGALKKFLSSIRFPSAPPHTPASFAPSPHLQRWREHCFQGTPSPCGRAFLTGALPPQLSLGAHSISALSSGQAWEAMTMTPR